MRAFDYDVVIVGSGFGGSVAALRAAEKGYRVGVMEAGRRWKDVDIPKTQWNLPHFLGFPVVDSVGHFVNLVPVPGSHGSLSCRSVIRA
jgi:cholesterol oxidase